MKYGCFVNRFPRASHTGSSKGLHVSTHPAPSQRCEHSPQTEQTENDKDDFHTHEKGRMVLRSYLDCTDVKGKHEHDGTHAERVTHESCSRSDSRGYTVKPLFNGAHDCVRVGRREEGKSKTVKCQGAGDEPQASILA